MRDVLWISFKLLPPNRAPSEFKRGQPRYVLQSLPLQFSSPSKSDMAQTDAAVDKQNERPVSAKGQRKISSPTATSLMKANRLRQIWISIHHMGRPLESIYAKI